MHKLKVLVKIYVLNLFDEMRSKYVLAGPPDRVGHYLPIGPEM